jgi:hypothetical protein
MVDWITSGDSVAALSHKIFPVTGGTLVDNGGYFYHVRIFFNDSSAGSNCMVYAVKIIYN